MDGARLANAAAAGFDLTQIARLGVDMLVFGGAKAGANCTEAIVMFDKSLARRIDNRLKQAGQTASKARFLAAPFLGLLESGDWEDGAAHANLMAQRLAEGIASRSAFVLAHPVEANAVFVRMPPEAHAAAECAGLGLLHVRRWLGAVRLFLGHANRASWTNWLRPSPRCDGLACGKRLTIWQERRVAILVHRLTAATFGSPRGKRV